MADLKISGLTDGAPAQAADIVPVARGATTRRLSLTNVISLLGSTFAALVHTHAESDVTNLVTDLAAKGDFSSNTSTAVDSEVMLFSGTGGKTGKRATGTGPAKISAGVLSAAAIDLSGAEATGTLAAGRFPALTGPVTTAAGALGTTIATNAITTTMITDANVTKAKIENIAASMLLGRTSGGAGAPQEITVGTNLTMTGTTLSASGGTGDVVGPSSSVDGEVALFNSTTGKLIKRASGTGITRVASGVQSAAELSGDITTSGSNAATIANDAVSYAKMQNVSAASKLLGRGSASGAGDPEEITLGSNLTMTGTTLAATSGGAPTVRVYDNAPAVLAINTTNLETTLYSFTITGGDLTATKNLRVTLRGNVLANSGTPTFTFRIKLGATTMWGDVSPGLGAMATRGSWTMDFVLSNLNATNAQALQGYFASSNRAATASIAGIGDIGATGLLACAFGGTAAEDTTTNLVLAVTVQPSVSNVAVEVLRQIAFAELVG